MMHHVLLKMHGIDITKTLLGRMAVTPVWYGGVQKRP